jgi:hypothetical protein
MAAKKTRSPAAPEGQGKTANDVDRDPPADDATGLRDRIARLAYYKAEQRGFEPGYALADWLEAEAELGRRWSADCA